MFESRVIVAPFVGECESPVERLFQVGRQHALILLSKSPRIAEHSPQLFLFHRALQRMLLSTCEIYDLRHLCFCHLKGKHAANTHTTMVDMERDLGGRFSTLVEKPLQDMNHELHRSVVVIQQEHTIERRL